MSDAFEEANRLRENELSDIRHVMATPHGRRFIWRLLAEARIFHEPGPASADILNHANGRRGLGLLLYNDVRVADIDAFRTMEFENTILAAVEEDMRQGDKVDGTFI